MFKTEMDLTNTLDPFKLKLEMGNRLFFSLPNIEISVDDGGEKSKYTIEDVNDSFELSKAYPAFLEKFIFSNDQNHRNNFFNEHTLERDIAAGILIVTPELNVINNYCRKLRNFDKETSQFNKLVQALYKYATTKKIVIDTQAICFKKEDTNVIIEFNKPFEPNVTAIKHKIGDTKASAFSNDITVEDDISLYLAGIDYEKLEQEIKTLFGDTITSEKPDLSHIQSDLSDMQKLIQSFLTLEISSDRSVKSAASFRFSFDNGVLLNLSEDETLELGREFGQLILINKRTNVETRLPLSRARSINRPNIVESIIAMRALYLLFVDGSVTLLDIFHKAILSKDKDAKIGTFTFRLNEQLNPEIVYTTDTLEFIILSDKMLKLTINNKENHEFKDSLYFTVDQIKDIVDTLAKKIGAEIVLDDFLNYLKVLEDSLKTLKRYSN
jgi:hypothetical protein